MKTTLKKKSSSFTLIELIFVAWGIFCFAAAVGIGVLLFHFINKFW